MRTPCAKVVLLWSWSAIFAGVLLAESGATEVDNGHFEKFTNGFRAMRWRYRGAAWHVAEGVGVKNSRAMVYENADPSFDGMPSQLVAFTKGARACVEADIRIDGMLAGTGGAFVEAEWFDEKGGRLGSVATQPIASTAGDWQHVTVVADKAIPEEAVKCRVCFGVTKGCTGKVVFDNVRFARWYNPRLLNLTTSAPGNKASDGRVTLTAKLDLSEVNPKNYKGLFIWRGADGKSHITPPTTMDGNAAKLDLNVRDLAFGRSVIAFILQKGARNEVDARLEITFER